MYETVQALNFPGSRYVAQCPFTTALQVKNRLTVQDLYGENLMLMHRNWSRYVDELRDDIWQNHSEIHIIDFDFYSVDIFNRCENSNDVLMAVQAWEHVHPLLKVIPVEWDHSIPYGLLHSPPPHRKR